MCEEIEVIGNIHATELTVSRKTLVDLFGPRAKRPDRAKRVTWTPEMDATLIRPSQLGHSRKYIATAIGQGITAKAVENRAAKLGEQASSKTGIGRKTNTTISKLSGCTWPGCTRAREPSSIYCQPHKDFQRNRRDAPSKLKNPKAYADYLQPKSGRLNF